MAVQISDAGFKPGDILKAIERWSLNFLNAKSKLKGYLLDSVLFARGTIIIVY